MLTNMEKNPRMLTHASQCEQLTRSRLGHVGAESHTLNRKEGTFAPQLPSTTERGGGMGLKHGNPHSGGGRLSETQVWAGLLPRLQGKVLPASFLLVAARHP